MIRIARTAALCVAAAVTAAAGAFVHPSTARVAGVDVPYGVALALSGLGALLMLGHTWARSRVDKIVVATAWLVPMILLSQQRGAGDLVVAADLPGLIFLYGGLVLVGVAVGMPVPRPSQDAGTDGEVR